jgi:Concanavalin A-like lectin/glucanases superfamily
MKQISIKLWPAFLSLMVISITMSSCFKKFDPKSYAPPLTIGGYTSSKEIAPANLVGYWGFNGSLTDSVSLTSGTNTGATYLPGIKGQAYKGSAAAYALFTPGAAIQNLRSYTITFWMNSPTIVGAIGIFTISNPNDFWGNLDIYQDNGGSGTQAVFKVHMNNTNVPWSGQFPDTKITTGSWIHVAITYNAATSIFNIYQNGSPLGVNSAGNPANTIGPRLNGSDPGAPPITPYGPLQFANPAKIAFGTFQFQTTPSLSSAGAQVWATGFAGMLDEFRIYNKALTFDEINSLMKLEGRGK